MDKVFEEKMKDSLLAMKEELVRSLISESEDFEALVRDMDPKDLVDVAADDIDRKTLEALNAQEVKRIRLIDSALSRLKNGRYGLCMRCGKKIPTERLEAIPYALMCIECKSSDERRSR
ncbi:TraR/DksA family transcriptional regulator [Sediminispirochaeta smaragdinae]|uniref:Transcriptional regulator, TraR/DksA family n=1 Tax=Sediminispirochaeta smaragdinae (strain DSM 11293 / JCM 15392 / SEBR 4228) TaxID=573413 RepID=E1RB81_SEDSS|nr:TraR/DksA family transcriptional regulator [Sediminispirochaeta smaragdinae]ADK79611.1 transcriptional regulator, TraR/DksA family [Sediminispirochaeta smaragdinae DSM 11293]